MEPDTITTPKITKTTFKFGSGNLAGQVAKNSQKITLLRRIVTRQNVNIGEKITPKITSMEESLLSTNIILTDVAAQLQKDFSSRLREQKELLEVERNKTLESRRNLKEEKLEATKTGKFTKKITNVVAKPFKNIFDRLRELATILGTGLLINNLTRLFANEKFQEGLRTVFDWTTKNWKLISAIGGGLLALKLFGTVNTLVGLAGLLKAIVFNPIFIGAAAFLISSQYKGLEPNFKEALSELYFMGGPTKENREKLIAKLESEKAKINPILDFPSGRRDEIDQTIDFLKTGITKNVFLQGKQRIDFDALESGVSFNESIREGKQFHDGGYNIQGEGTVHEGEFVLKKSAVDKIGLEKLYALNEGASINYSFEDLPPIDVRTMKTVTEGNVTPATSVVRVNSSNSSNPYMNEVPISFGFSHLVYS